MAITSPVYATREDVKNAIDSRDSARNNSQIDRAVEAGSRAVESLLHRVFYPTTTTKYFDWPNESRAVSWRLWLDQNELVSVSSLISGTTAIVPADYFLEPVSYGPPFDRIEIDLASTASFSSGDTYQRSIAVTGVFGYDNVTSPAGALTAAGINSSVTSITCTDASQIGVGSLITIDSEKMLVTEKTMVATGLSLVGSSTLSMADNIVVTTDGTKFAIGEVILMGSERALIVDISGNNLIVKRAWDGTVLATHSGSALSALRTLAVVRAAQGTTAASHLASAAISVQIYPSLVRSLTIAQAVSSYSGETSGYVGGGSEGNSTNLGGGLAGIQKQAYDLYGRKARVRAV